MTIPDPQTPRASGDSPSSDNDSQAKQHAGLLLIVSGPSGVGKSTIAHAIESGLDAQFSVSVTTRPKSAKDVEGRDYYFVDRTEFQRRIEDKQFLEWAQVYGNYYGTPKPPVEQAIEAGRLVLLEIDVQGAEQVKSNRPDAFGLFILPPSEDELLRRLRNRGRDDEETIQKRFARARAEITRAKDGNIYDVFIVNDDLDLAIDQAIAAVEHALAWRS